MHILIIPSWYPQNQNDVNGCFFREQAIGLVQNGHQVGVFSLSGDVGDSQLRNIHLFFGVPTKENDFGVRTYRISHLLYRYSYKKYILPLIIDKYFKKYCTENGQPNLIHVQSALPAGLYAKRIKKKLGVPYCVTEHSSAFPRRLLSVQQKKDARKVFHDAEVVMCVSPALASSVESECQLNTKLRVIPNFLNQSFEQMTLPEKRTGGRFRFLNVGLLTAKKGQNILVRSFATQFRGKPVELMIGGDGEEFDNLLKLTCDLGITDQVKLLGHLSRHEVKEHIIKCDAFVLSSLYETFGVVVIEALACGKPVVATRCGGPEDIVNDFNGILVAKDSERALSEGMLYTYNNISNYSSVKIRDDCVSRFGQSSVVDSIERIYQQILSY